MNQFSRLLAAKDGEQGGQMIEKKVSEELNTPQPIFCEVRQDVIQLRKQDSRLSLSQELPEIEVAIHVLSWAVSVGATHDELEQARDILIDFYIKKEKGTL